jgi:hypothetical protein
MPGLTQLDDDVWATTRPLSFLGLHIGSRTTVIRLPDGGLWVHSPVALNDELRGALDDLGPVRYVVAPNLYHHLHAGDYAAAYPKAELHGAPGLGRKRTDLNLHAELGHAPAGWADSLQQIFFPGMLMKETVFFHPASRTLVVCDLLENFESSDHWPTRMYLKVGGIHGRPGVSRLLRPAFRDHKAMRTSLDRVFDWDFDRVVLAHGNVLEHDGPTVLRDSYTWLRA